MAGNTAPLPVKGSVSVAGAIEVVVVVVLPCRPTVTTVAGPVVVVSFTVVGATPIDVVVALDVVVAAVVVVDPWIPDTAVVVGAIVVVVGAIVVVVVAIVEVVGQLLGGGSDADCVKSRLRSLFRIVSVTVPLDGAGPLASQIWRGWDNCVVL